MGCGSSLDAMYDDPMPTVVFGATGMVGGAVAKALLRDRRFEVKAVTRTPTTETARKLAEDGAIIVTADLNDPRSLQRAMEGAHAVFLTTHYWEHLSMEKEVVQGKNGVDAAVAAGVAHLVVQGSDSPKALDIECDFLESKADIEKHVKNTTLPYTVLHMPFFFENLLTVFRPHKIKPGVFAVALPLEGKALDCVSVTDVGKAVVRLLLRPKDYLCRTLTFPTEKLTAQHMAETLGKHITDRKFIAAKMKLKDYEQFNFDGAKDLAAMFHFYQSNHESHDPRVTRKFSGMHRSFDRWVHDNKEFLIESMDAEE